jgi:dephospho-CoA kinase
MAALRVGLTGGIGSGKSVVAEMLRGHGVVIVDADVIARDVVEPGLPAHAEIARRFPSVIGPDGRIVRPALARIVFADAEEREALNAIVHPRVRARAALLEREAPAGAVVVHVIPLLFEGDYWKSCDRTVAVVAPDEERIARVIARDAATREAVVARIAAQLPAAEVAERADIVIANDADLATLRTRVAALSADLANLAETRTIAFPPRRPD